MMGEQSVKNMIDKAPPADPPIKAKCPITPLGHRAGRYYFITAAGEVRGFLARELNVPGFQDLMAGNLGWLEEFFNKDADKRSEAEFSDFRARNWLIKQCQEKGLFDDSLPVRSVGVWRSPESITPVVHCGNKILFNGAWMDAGFIQDNAMYLAAPAVARPADEAATVVDGDDILQALSMWNWAMPGGAEIMVGLIGQALLAGALRWKAHGLIHGVQGAGKSTLCRFVERVLGPAAHPSTNNFTEAGLRQSMTDQARAFLLDEAESDGLGGKMKAVIEMLRQMSSDGGSSAKRGAAQGSAGIAYRLNGAAMLFCIAMPVLDVQDKARITVLKLNEIQNTMETKDSDQDIDKAMRLAEELSPKIRARAIEGFERYFETFRKYRSVMASMGYDNRACDQIGTILAGRDLLMIDEVPDDARVTDGLALARPLLEEWSDMRQYESEALNCLSHLLTSRMNVYSRDRNDTVGTTIAKAKSPQSDGWEKRALAEMGLRLERPDGKTWELWVANKHEGLEAMFRSIDKWQRGNWGNALETHPDIRSGSGAQRFSGVATRYKIIPDALLPEPLDPAGPTDARDPSPDPPPTGEDIPLD